MTTAIVVGSGPNGLAAALTLAKSGLEVTVLEAAGTPGGGARSVEMTLPGLLHDECSGFHPLAIDNAFSRSVDLAAHGLAWEWPEVQYAHPLENGAGAAAVRDVTATARALFDDGRAWARVFGASAGDFRALSDDVLGPMLRLPGNPMVLARLGTSAGLPASMLARWWASTEARALFAGVAAHAFRPFDSIASSAIGVVLGTAAHVSGWPVARGGSRSIVDAMIRALDERGGRVETGIRVSSLSELPPADVVMLDTSPAAAAAIAGERMPGRIARAYRRFSHGPGAFTASFAVEGGIPWAFEPAARAGTVHLGGTFEEIAAAESAVHRGRMPERPFVLLGQQHLADPGRSSGSAVPIDAYAHVPAGFDGDALPALVAQIERFAPGFRERILATEVRSTTALEAGNPNIVRGDIVGGANSAFQLVFRPRPAIDPYSTGIPGVYLCSAGTPPGAGAHGMCGFNAALSALSHL